MEDFEATFKQKEIGLPSRPGFTISRYSGAGFLASKKCDTCNKMPTKNYCRYLLKRIKIFIECENVKICSLASCFGCK